MSCASGGRDLITSAISVDFVELRIVRRVESVISFNEISSMSVQHSGLWNSKGKEGVFGGGGAYFGLIHIRSIRCIV